MRVRKSWIQTPAAELLSELSMFLNLSRASLVAQSLKCLPPMWETWVQSLGWEDPLEKEMATHSSILTWRIPVDRGAWQNTVHRVTKESDRTEAT